ncbi:hypothetical protein D9615_006761 [Tricholomella constricta]|uniref:HAD-like protein n=1 Tax=Tricholomella constricta TaxID=117010 RepID=A0A8H5H747_9AGAR|nr:hypothetical protein D9615_006761 [Tricholomella constricta]
MIIPMRMHDVAVTKIFHIEPASNVRHFVDPSRPYWSNIRQRWSSVAMVPFVIPQDEEMYIVEANGNGQSSPASTFASFKQILSFNLRLGAKVARDIGQDPVHVIAATHGKRAIDNLAHFRPEIEAHQMDDEVEKFEETILYFADAYNLHGPGSQMNSGANTPYTPSSAATTPALTPANSTPSSRSNSVSLGRRPSFTTRLINMLTMTSVPEQRVHVRDVDDDVDGAFEASPVIDDKTQRHMMEAWQLEAANIDRSVQILPGVKKLMDSLPAGRYAVATSGAKTYAYGCMTRVGITPPAVTITADDKRLKAGKPAPDPFLLAAECLGYEASKCVVFEDSPSGIRAGVASGAIVIAVCTSHERSKIENCGAHYIVDNLESIHCSEEGDRLRFTVTL